MSAETTHHPSLEARALTDPARVVSGQASEVEPLERRLDDLAQQVLGARDAALGAEAELGVARGRITDLERRVHVLTVENEELRAALDRRRVRNPAAAMVSGDRPATDVARDAARDLTRGAVRRVKRRLGA